MDSWGQDSTRRRAIILGGTGAIGAATAESLSRAGWSVEVTGRNPSRVPDTLAEKGVRFHRLERHDAAGFGRLVGPGADLVVDLVAYSAADIELLLPYWGDVDSVVVASSRAVYVDPLGRHINGHGPPQFTVPIAEQNPTLPPAAEGTDPFTRAGYGLSKAAVERAALDSGLPVTIIRPSKVHGPWARNARTRSVVEQMLSGSQSISLMNRGRSLDHLSAATNVASLIRTASEHPGARILNAADPDPLPAVQIFEAVAEALGWAGELHLLDREQTGGEHPWNAAHPIVLDMSAAAALGYRPVAPGR